MEERAFVVVLYRSFAPLILYGLLYCLPQCHSALQSRSLRTTAVMWIRILIHLGLWIQRYKMKGKAAFNHIFVFFS